MEKIPMCPRCGNTRKGEKVRKCEKGHLTCQRCSPSKCSVCGTSSYQKWYEIG